MDIPCVHDLQRLKVAYVNKERAAQYEENRFLRQMENDREQAISDKVQYGAVPVEAIIVHFTWQYRGHTEDYWL